MDKLASYVEERFQWYLKIIHNVTAFDALHFDCPL